jgi:hypothetical protein
LSTVKEKTCNIRVKSTPLADVGDINIDPTHWINIQGAENYYTPPGDDTYWDRCTIKALPADAK